MRAIVTFHKIMNPLQLTPSDYIENRFSENEREALNDINLKYDDLRYFFQKSTALKLLDVANSLNRVAEVLSPEEENLINSLQKDYYDEIHRIYLGAFSVYNNLKAILLTILQQNTEYTLPFFLHKISWQLFDIIKHHENQDILWYFLSYNKAKQLGLQTERIFSRSEKDLHPKSFPWTSRTWICLLSS